MIKAELHKNAAKLDERIRLYVNNGRDYVGKWEVSWYGPAEKGQAQVIETVGPGLGKSGQVFPDLYAAYRAAADHNEELEHKMAHHAETGE